MDREAWVSSCFRSSYSRNDGMSAVVVFPGDSYSCYSLQTLTEGLPACQLPGTAPRARGELQRPAAEGSDRDTGVRQHSLVREEVREQMWECWSPGPGISWFPPGKAWRGAVCRVSPQRRAFPVLCALPGPAVRVVIDSLEGQLEHEPLPVLLKASIEPEGNRAGGAPAGHRKGTGSQEAVYRWCWPLVAKSKQGSDELSEEACRHIPGRGAEKGVVS